MKILCLSDYVDPLIYNQNVANAFNDIDLILCAGDLPMDYVDFVVTMFNKPTYFVFGNHDLKEFKYYHKVPQSSSMKYQSEKIDKNKRDTSGHGHGAIYLGFKSARNHKFKIRNNNTGRDTPLLLAGATGSIRYNNGMAQYTDFQMKMKLIKLIPSLLLNKLLYGRYVDIFMTHASPRHIHDHEDPCHKGFDCFNWFLKKFKPTYMVHGHIHLYDMREERVGQYYDSTVVNAYAHYVIELPDEFQGEEK